MMTTTIDSTYTIDSLIEQMSSSLSNSANNISENLSPDDERWIMEELQRQNNPCPSNETSSAEIEHLQSDPLLPQPSNHAVDTNLPGENTQILATGNEFSNEQRNDRATFGHWYLQQLQTQLENIAVNLTGDTIPIEYERFRQACQDNPQTVLTPEGFNMFFSMIHHGQQLSQSNSQHSFIGEESDRVTGRNSTAPSDQNEDHTHVEIQVLAQSDPMESHTEEPCSSSVPTIDLTKLLLEQLEIIKGEISMALELIHPPKLYWHARTIKCLAKQDCPPLQSKTQRELIVLEWSTSTKFDEKNLFIYVKLLAYDDETHPSKFIVPPGTKVAGIGTQSVSIDKEYGCNLINRTILYPLTKVKSDTNQVVLPIFMFNSFKTKGNPELEQDITIKNKTSLDFIQNELAKICKLRFAMCRLTDNGQLERVSEYVDTELIRESKGTEELKPIDRSHIVPTKPCECGEEDIHVHLNTNSEKSGFIVIIDGQKLGMREFEGITKNAMTIHPPMKKHEVDGFDLTIEKFNVLKTIQENRDPCDVENLDKDKDTLWNGRIQYSEHPCPGDHPHESKKAKKK